MPGVKQSNASATSAHETSILAYNGSNITFELSGGEVMVNLTEMAKAFGKRPNDFLGLPSTNELIEAVTRKFGITRSEVVTTIKGNYSDGRNQGTWANRLVALSFAQWLSVDFHLICLEKIEELLTQGVATIDNDEETIARAMAILNKRLEEKKLQLSQAHATIKEQNQAIEESKPKVLFANALIGSTTSCLIGELAKILTQNGLHIGQNKLFTWLRSHGYLGKTGDRYNVPNQKYIEMGLFEIKKGVRSGNNGVLHTTITTKVTPKGQAYFINKLLPKATAQIA